MKVIGLSGSLRAASKNRLLLREAARLGDAQHYVEADLNLPLFDEDLEAQGIPASVTLLGEQIAEADAVMISTPEYNKGISGVLKNALDWMSRLKPNPLVGKPTAIMASAAGRAGGERAQAMLRQCLVAFQPRLVAGPELHIASHFGEYDEAGQLTGERYRDDVTSVMAALRTEVQRG